MIAWRLVSMAIAERRCFGTGLLEALEGGAAKVHATGQRGCSTMRALGWRGAPAKISLSLEDSLPAGMRMVCFSSMLLGSKPWFKATISFADTSAKALTLVTAEVEVVRMHHPGRLYRLVQSFSSIQLERAAILAYLRFLGILRVHAMVYSHIILCRHLCKRVNYMTHIQLFDAPR